MKAAFALGISLIFSACLAAAEPPSTAVLAGAWVIDVAKSDFGPMPTPSRVRLEIKVTGVEFHVAQQGDDGDFNFVFRTDGKETTNNLPDGNTLRAKYRFEGNVLVGELEADGMTMKDRLTVDGKTMVIDRVRDGAMKQRMVFNLEAPKAKAAVMAGAWKGDMAQSDFGGMPFSRFDANIRVDGHDIVAEHITDRGTFTFKVRDDDTETTNDLGTMTMKGKMHWEGDVLVGVTEYANANGVFATYRDRSEFSADGKTMTMHRAATTLRGDVKMKIVLVKQ